MSQEQPILPCPVCGTHALMARTKFFKRPQRWSPQEPIRWLSASPSRSGSTVVFQLMNLFDDGATVKTHAIHQADCPMIFDIEGVICTIRHPYDMFASLLYMFKEKQPEDFCLNKDSDIVKKLDKELNSTLGLLRYKNYMIPLYSSMGLELCPIIFLKYEECQENPAKRVSEIAKIMKVDLSDDDIERITKDHTVQKNIERIASGEHRTEDIKGTAKTKNIYFEKNHIGPGKGKSQGGRLPQEVKDLIFKNYAALFEEFNYNKDI